MLNKITSNLSEIYPHTLFCWDDDYDYDDDEDYFDDEDDNFDYFDN